MSKTETSITFIENKPLSELCTFGIGGPARYFIEARTIETLQEVIPYCINKNLPYLVIGKGSNCLFDDKGFNGLVILNKIDFIEYTEPTIVHVGAGYSFSLLGTQTARKELAGLEFASGIPGSVGGAVFMNAGANGSETCESLISVDYVDDNGIFTVLPKEKLSFSYRTSAFQNLPGAVVGATFKLTPMPTARQKQLEIITYRKKTQPYSDKSAGCVFRNPTCGQAGALIDKCGLKGFRVGGAAVSNLHANFLINAENGSAKDVLSLIEGVKKQVKEQTHIDLEVEVRYIPYK